MNTMSFKASLLSPKIEWRSWWVYLIIDIPLAAMAFYSAHTPAESYMWVALFLAIGCIGVIDELNLSFDGGFNTVFDPVILLALPGVILIITLSITSDFLRYLVSSGVGNGIS